MKHRNERGWLNWLERDATYHLDRKSTITINSRVFFYFMDVGCANTYIVYNIMHPNDLTLLDFKTIISIYLIRTYINWSRAPLDSKRGSKRKYQYQFQQGNLLQHLPEFRNIWRRCEFCYKDAIDLKTYVKCRKCEIFLCLIKFFVCLRNCFKRHLKVSFFKSVLKKDMMFFKLFIIFSYDL